MQKVEPSGLNQHIMDEIHKLSTFSDIDMGSMLVSDIDFWNVWTNTDHAMWLKIRLRFL